MGKWLLGIIILALITLFMSIIWPFSATQRSADMGQTIQTALNNNGYDFATVNMSGNVARLSGEAPTDTALSAAVALATNTKCEACESKDTWHEVASDLTVKKVAAVQPVRPYTFAATKSEDGRVVLDGYVRNEAERERVLREANVMFPNMVTDNTVKVAPGAPNDRWADVVAMNMSELKLLERGTLNMEDTQTVLRGLAADADVRDRINAMVTGLPTGYEGASNIAVPNAAAVNVGEVKSESICQTLFDDLKGDNKINFAYNKAGINGAQSYDLLNTLASAAKQCASFRIAVIGHTDSDGGDDYNQALSEARANSVAAYLADNGVALARLSAKGMGESTPIASNDTPEGKAQNRRIEFVVTQAN
ncbi:OmpA family protein [Fretibacter rubidus]|uniref:OmpA family protein n=1 Tax=Fretibacter rubidus TaxID=570162 RepID=UPI00352A9359